MEFQEKDSRKFIKMNPIWVTEDENKRLLECKLMVTDEVKLKSVVEDLQNIDTYIYIDSYNRCGNSTKHFEYNSFGAIGYREGKAWHMEDIYCNPRASVYQLITGDSPSTNDLLNLFATVQCGSSMATCDQDFYKAKEMIHYLESQSLDPIMIGQILKGMWPSFGWFAVECLDCTEVYPVYSYDIEELLNNSSGTVVCLTEEERNEILSNQYKAQKNSQVLALAKKAYQISR